MGDQRAAEQSGADLPFDRMQARLLPLADVTMVAMLSRPESGTLRNTRVTVVTNVLAAAVAVGAFALGLVVLLRTMQGMSPLWLVAELPLIAAATACADLAVYGIRQRALLSRR